jgi:hypothetical protein
MCRLRGFPQTRYPKPLKIHAYLLPSLQHQDNLTLIIPVCGDLRMRRGLFELSDTYYARLPWLFRTPRWELDRTVGVVLCLAILGCIALFPLWVAGFYVVFVLWELQRKKMMDDLYEQEERDKEAETIRKYGKGEYV